MSGFGQTYNKITTLAELTDGYYVIAESNSQFAMNNTHNGTYLGNTAITPVSATITNPNAAIVWKIETNGTAKTIFNENTSKYVSYTGSSNNVQIVNSVTSNNQRWNITYVSGDFVITNLAVTNRDLQYNSSSPRFACYKGTQNDLALYKLAAPSTPNITVTPNTITDLDYEIGNGPSTAQSFDIEGVLLTAGIDLTAPTNFEIANTITGPYSTTLNIPLANANNTNTIYTRLIAGLPVNTYSGTLTMTNLTAGISTTPTVSLSGEVTVSTETITVTQATGGTISPGTTIVNTGTNQSFTATADPCYTFTNWIVDGVNTGNTNPYTFTNVTTNHTITAVYTQDTYNITASTGANGSISPSGNTTVSCGSNQTYNITADSGYAVADVLVDGVSVGTVTSYDFTNVTAAHTISVMFEIYVGPCGSESFTNSNAGNSYGNGNYTGDNGVTWTYVASRNDDGYQISGEGLMLRQSSSNSKVTSSSVSGGIGDFTCKLKKAYTGSGNRQVELFVNGVSQGTSIAWDNTTTQSFNVSGINISGNVIIEIRNITGKQVIVDDIEWTCYSATPEPEIEIKGNSIEIVNGSNSPNTLDDTDFGNVAVAGGTNPNTFTIYNTGTADLEINSVISDNPTEFTISGISSNTIITAGNNASFTVTFNPSAINTRTATITVNNDDADESSYTFDVTGNGSNSAASDIIANASFVYNSNINYTQYQAATINNTTQSIDVFKFDIRDGGATNDTDAFGTELNEITFNVLNNENIRSAALFNGNALVSNTGIVSGSTISFSGLSYTAPDNGTASLSLRVTFLQTVTDNDQLEFTISTASANTSGSVFESANAGGIISSTLNNRNRIEVTSDRIAFTIQPTSTSVNTDLNTFHISAVDQFGNIDLDDTLSIVLTTSGAGMTSFSPYSLTNGDLAISNVQFNTSQTNINLTATTTGLAFSNTTTSTNFDILDVATGTYRTTSNGTWPSGTATWERLTTSGWVTATPAANTTELLIIRHTVTSRASFAAPAPRTSMTVENGASFDDGHNSTFGNLLVQDGGTFIASNPAVDIDPTGTITLENNARLILNSATLNNADGLWEGTENFYPESILEIQDWDWESNSGEERLIDYTNPISLNSDGYYFGHIYFNATPDEKAFTIIGEIGTHKLCNNLTVNNKSFLKNVILTNVNANIEIGGHVEVIQNKFAFGAVGSSNLTHTVKGNIIANGGIIDINQQSAGAATVLVNLEGDLIGTSGTIQSTDGDCGIAFTGSILQNIDVANAVPYNKINTYIKNNAEVQLLNNNLKLNSNSTFTVEDGGTFNFNWAADNTTPLLISNGSSGSNIFTSNQGSILKITHLDGLVKNTANAGNVQLSITNKTFNQTASFHYLGKDNQVTGDGISTGSTGKLIYVNLLDNTKTLSLTNNIGIANATTLHPNGGTLEIQKGIVLGTNTGDFKGSGRLVMTDGEYRISTITTTPESDYLPQLSNYSNYNLSGGTVNLNGDDDIQILSGSPTYYNLNFSGTNTYSTLPPLPPDSNYKGISNATKVSNAITIYEDAIVNVGNKSLGATHNPSFTMLNNSRYITDGSGEKPDTSGAYSLAPNTVIEYANNSGAGIVRIGSPKINYANIEVTGTNVSNNSITTGIHFQNGGTFTVKPNATFKVANTAGFNGSNSTAIDTDNNPIITLEDNSTIQYKGELTTQTITNYTPEYKNVTLSGAANKTLGHPTDILIGEDLNITSSLLTINTNEALTIDEGLKILGGSLNINDSGSLIQINETDTNSGPISMSRNTSIRKLDYVYWSAPISGYNINTIYDTNTPTNNIYRWDTTISNPNSGQGNWVSAAGETMQRGVGYIVRGPNNFSNTAANYASNFTNGQPFNGAFEVDVKRGTNSTSDDDDWNLIGNPYPSSISVMAFLTNTKNTISLDGFVNIWTHGTLPSDTETDPFYDDFGTNYTADDYITHNGTGTTSGPGTFNGYIAAGQSFMVNTVNGNATTLKAEFKNDMRSKAFDNSNFYRTATTNKHRIWLDLTPENGTSTRILIGYIEGATNGRDRIYDAITDAQPFYSIINNQSFIIQGKALPFIDTDVIPLGVQLSTAGNYTISIAAIDGIFDTENQDIYIKDNLNQITFNITNNPYTFTSDVGTFDERFELVFKPQTLSINDALLDAENLSILTQNNGDITFSVAANFKIKTIEIIDTLGRSLYQLQGDSHIETYNLSRLNDATYIAKVTLSNGQVITKKTVIRNQ